MVSEVIQKESEFTCEGSSNSRHFGKTIFIEVGGIVQIHLNNLESLLTEG